MKKKKIWMIVFFICLVMTGCSSAGSREHTGTCTILVECSTVLEHMDRLDAAVKDYVPESGIILEERAAEISEGDSVYDVLKRELKRENILMEASFTGSSAYIEGIDNIYEFSCGDLSGWMYSVNGEFPEKSCSEYTVADGDVIAWRYTCNLGEDVKE